MIKKLVAKKDFIIGVVFLLLFSGLAIARLSGELAVDRFVNNWFSSLDRSGFTLLFMDNVSTFLSTEAIGIYTILLAVYLFSIYRSKVAGWFLSVMFVGALLIWIAKNLVDASRPVGGLLVSFSEAFPSGHVGATSLFLLSLSYIIFVRSTFYGKISYVLSSLVIVLVALSRLYLGLHWLTDTVGSLLLATGVVLIFITVYKVYLENISKSNSRVI